MSNTLSEPTSVKITIDDKTYELPIPVICEVLYNLLPDWIKSSDVTPMVNGEPDQKLVMARVAFKSFAAGDLPNMAKQIYGPDFKLGRRDPMPVIAQWMVLFLVGQLAYNPIVLSTHEGQIVGMGYQKLEPCEDCP